MDLPCDDLVSVLFSAYNGAAHLTEAMESLLAQTWKKVEIIAIDDSSTDDTGRILEGFARRDDRVRVFRNAKNLGLTASLIYAHSLAKGEFIARQDADDLSHPERFDRQVRYLCGHADVGALGSAYFILDDGGETLNTRYVETNPVRLKRVLAKRNILAHGSLMFRRVAFEAAGGYRSVFRYAQDYDLLLRMSALGLISALSDPLYSLRLNAGSVGSTQSRRQFFYAQLSRKCAAARLRSGHDADVLKNLQLDEEQMQGGANTGSTYLLNLSVSFLQAGKSRTAREMVKKSGGPFTGLKSFVIYFLTLMPVRLTKIFFQWKWKWEGLF